MNILFPDLSDDEILVKIAQRAACLLKAAKAEVDDHNLQYIQFVADYLSKPVIAGMLNDKTLIDVRSEVIDRVVNLIQDQFDYVMSTETDVVVKSFRSMGNAIVSEDIATHKWGPDTCGCKIHIATRSISDQEHFKQSFYAKRCEAHKTLSISELHDVVHDENDRKNSFRAAISRDVPQAIQDGYPYRWSFDIDRNLVVDMTRLPLQVIENVKNLANTPVFKGKVIING